MPAGSSSPDVPTRVSQGRTGPMGNMIACCTTEELPTAYVGDSPDERLQLHRTRCTCVNCDGQSVPQFADNHALCRAIIAIASADPPPPSTCAHASCGETVVATNELPIELPNVAPLINGEGKSEGDVAKSVFIFFFDACGGVHVAVIWGFSKLHFGRVGSPAGVVL